MNMIIYVIMYIKNIFYSKYFIMKNYIIIIAAILIFVRKNNTIAIESKEVFIHNSINKSNEEQERVTTIKNEFLNTYIED